MRQDSSGAGSEDRVEIRRLDDRIVVALADGYENLTHRQQRKPLLGSGVSVPVMVQHVGSDGILLVATDGLLKYTSAEKICEVVRRMEAGEAPKSLIDLVRLRSGALQDDVALALCRRAYA